MIAILFWVFLFLAILPGIFGYRAAPNLYYAGGHLVLLFLLFLLGFKTFGTPLH